MFYLSEKSKKRLREYINNDKPFGPIKAEDINPNHTDVHHFLFEQHNRLYFEISQNPKIIIGRKGAGKTAYLTSVYLDEKYDFIVKINTADIFVKVIDYINNMLPTSVFSEKVADLWITIIEISIMVSILEKDEMAFSRLPEVRDYLAKIGVWGLSSPDEIVWKVVNFMRDNLKDKHIGIIAEALSSISDTTFQKCRSLVYKHLVESEKKVVVLIDTLDEFKLNTAEVSDAIAGLLKCVGVFNSKQHSADIRLCIPSELYHIFTSLSSNPAKDFESQFILHWHPRELIILASRRFQLYLQLHYPYYYEKYVSEDCDQFEPALNILEKFMPSNILNGLNFNEKTIVYLLRHTQLNPRQFLLILNNVFKHRRHSRERPKVSRDDIVKGVAASESLLTEEIFTSYKHVYKNAKSVVERCIPELPFRFDYLALGEVFEKVGKNVFGNNDMHEFTRMLIEVGIIGKHMRSKGPYHEALFEYTVSNQLHCSSSESLCIHPLFLNKFSARYNADDNVTVYPFGTDPYTTNDYRLMF